jgi:phenylalanyl-tRNA synthetase beta chain
VEVRLTDRFLGAPLPKGKASLTLSLEFRSAERTLTEADVSGHLERIRALLIERCGAEFAAQTLP